VKLDSEQIEGWNRECERAWRCDTHLLLVGTTNLGDPDTAFRQLQKYCPPPATVLDVGCGIGKHIAGFIKSGYICNGIEQSPLGVEYAQRINPTANITCMRIQQLNVENKYDMIHTSGVLQHNLNHRKPEILKVLRRALKPSGFLFITENTITDKNIQTYGGKYYDELTDGYSFTEKGWIKLMKQHGFKHVFTIFPWPYYLFKLSK